MSRTAILIHFSSKRLKDASQEGKLTIGKHIACMCIEELAPLSISSAFSFPPIVMPLYICPKSRENESFLEITVQPLGESYPSFFFEMCVGRTEKQKAPSDSTHYPDTGKELTTCFFSICNEIIICYVYILWSSYTHFTTNCNQLLTPHLKI